MIVSPLTPVPAIVGVVSFVISSVDTPESEPASRSGVPGAADAVLSTVTDNAEDADEAVPATSVCVAVIE